MIRPKQNDNIIEDDLSMDLFTKLSITEGSYNLATSSFPISTSRYANKDIVVEVNGPTDKEGNLPQASFNLGSQEMLTDHLKKMMLPQYS